MRTRVRISGRHLFCCCYIFIQTTLVLLMPMLMPMLMMLALTLMLPLDASDAAAYAVAKDANADAKMPNAARHLAGVYVVLLLPTLLPMMM